MVKVRVRDKDKIYRLNFGDIVRVKRETKARLGVLNPKTSMPKRRDCRAVVCSTSHYLPPTFIAISTKRLE